MYNTGKRIGLSVSMLVKSTVQTLSVFIVSKNKFFVLSCVVQKFYQQEPISVSINSKLSKLLLLLLFIKEEVLYNIKFDDIICPLCLDIVEEPYQFTYWGHICKKCGDKLNSKLLFHYITLNLRQSSFKY